MSLFDEIVELRDQDVRAVYRELTASTLAVVLKDAPQAVTEKFFTNMPHDMVAMMKLEIASLGDLSAAQIEAQQEKVREVVLKHR